MNILITSKDYDRGSGRCFYRFPSTTVISGKEVALLNAKFNNSFFNVSSALGNNTIAFRFPIYTGIDTVVSTSPTDEASGLFVLVLPDGFYSFEAMNLAIQDFFIRKGLYLLDIASGKNVYFATLRTNSIQYKIQLDTYPLPTQSQATIEAWTYPYATSPRIVNPNSSTAQTFFYTTQFVIGTIGGLLGIGSGFVPTNATAPTALPRYPLSTTLPASTPYGDLVVASTLGAQAPEVQLVTAVIVKTNLVSSSTSYPVDMLALVSVDSLFGAGVHWSASFPMFVPTASGNLAGIELSFCDQNLNPVKFYDPDVSFTLYIRDKQ